MTDQPFNSGENNPFEGMPLFGDLAKMMQQQGTVAWDAARQLALSIASGGVSEPNVDPIERIRFEQLARVADLQVSAATGLTTSITGGIVELVPLTRTQFAQQTLDDLRPLFDRLATALEPPKSSSDHPAGEALAQPDEDPSEAWLAGLMQMLSPMMLGMTAGSLVGNLTIRSFGLYDLPVPRPARDAIPVVVANLDAFGEEWSLDADDLRLWLCLHELTHHAVIGVPHVRRRLDDLLGRWASAFEADPHALERRLAEAETSGGDPMAGIQQLLSDPELLLGAVRTPAQADLQTQIEALVLPIEGYVDHIMDRIGATLIGSYGMVTEALRRRRVESSAADRYIERLFGLEFTQDRYDRGSAFIAGIVERAGDSALERLWADEPDLPTPAELDAPGLWLARVGIEISPDFDLGAGGRADTDFGTDDFGTDDFS